MRSRFRPFCRVLLLGILPMLLSACQSSGGVRLSPLIAPETGAPSGRVVGALGAVYERGGAVPFQMNTVYFRAVGERSGGEIFLSLLSVVPGDNKNLAIADGRLFVNPFALTLKPGDYEIYALEMRSDSGYVSQSQRTRTEYSSIGFHVEAGQVVYLGRMLAHAFNGNSVLGWNFRAGARIEIHDAMEEDRKLLISNGTLDAQTELIKAIPDFTSTPDGYLVRADRMERAARAP